MVSWQECIMSKRRRPPLRVQSQVGFPLPPPHPRHIPASLKLMSQVFRLPRFHSSPPAKLFCRPKLVMTDSSLLALHWRDRGKYLKHAAGNVQASIHRAWQEPAVSQPALLTKPSAAPVSQELGGSVFRQGLYLLFSFRKLTPKQILNHPAPGTWSALCWGRGFGGVALEAPQESRPLPGGSLLPVRTPWAQVA